MSRKSPKHKSHKLKPYRYKPSKRKGKSKKPIILMLALCLVVIVVVAYSMTNQSAPSPNKVLLKTSMGDITIQLYDDMPTTTENFKKLVQQGIYDGTIFHRVIDGFMIQGGDPTEIGNPPTPTIEDEFTDHNRNDRGTIAMANAGPNTGSSQFFINLVDNNLLDSEHPVFGKVIEGMQVVDEIGKVVTGLQPETDEMSRPLEDIRIVKAELIS